MKEKLYLNNLNGLRGIAALLVIVSHLELNKSYFNLTNSFGSVKDLGWIGVTLFFVLSGFLITYLLLREKEKNGFIAIKNFYFRRIYRIWPLYYFIVILSLLVLPHFAIFQIPNLKLDIESHYRILFLVVLFVFFLTNILISIKLIPFATQTWSVGTEEQFYLIWPLLISKSKRLLPIFITIILGYNVFLYLLDSDCIPNFKYYDVFNKFVHYFQLDCLTIGALGAYGYHYKRKFVDRLTHLTFFVGGIAVLFFAIISAVNLGFFKSTFYAIGFIIIILNLVNHPKLINILETRTMNYLGKISYGLYMYHQIVIVFVLNFLLKVNTYNSLLLYILSIPCIIVIAGLSYQFIERPFLNKKEKWATFRNQKSDTTKKDTTVH